MSEEENRQSSSSEHSYVDDAIDKLQESRRGEGDPDALDQAVDKLKGMFGSQ